MRDRKRLVYLLIVTFVLFTLPWGFNGGPTQTQAAVKADPQKAGTGNVAYKYQTKMKNRMRFPTLAERKAAAARFMAARTAAGNKAATSGGKARLTAAPGPRDIPDYFGP